MKRAGASPDSVPWVFQYNGRDATTDHALVWAGRLGVPDELTRGLLPSRSFVVAQADGTGVFDTCKQALFDVLACYKMTGKTPSAGGCIEVAADPELARHCNAPVCRFAERDRAKKP